MEMRKKYKEAEEKPRTVRQLLDSRKATPVVLGFIAATWAGQRVQRQEQETERQERVKDETSGLNEDRLEEDEEGGVDVERADKKR